MLVKLLGAPVQDGAGRRGCDMGPASFRAAGLAESIVELGHDVIDLGDVAKAPLKSHEHANPALKKLAETVAWVEALSDAAYQASQRGRVRNTPAPATSVVQARRRGVQNQVPNRGR